jgi:PhnB protein
MKINPYLIFNGDCKAAFTFYAQSLQGRIEAMTTFGETPVGEQMPKDLHNLIIHTRLLVGDQVLMGSDTTFWAARFGMLVDRFGVSWMVNCEKDQ